MVFKVTIAIDGMVPAQPLGPMVFQWFFIQPTIGDDIFQWFFIQPTIGDYVFQWFFIQPTIGDNVFQWFFIQPTIGDDDFQPLVQQCNGNDTSFRSNIIHVNSGTTCWSVLAFDYMEGKGRLTASLSFLDGWKSNIMPHFQMFFFSKYVSPRHPFVFITSGSFVISITSGSCRNLEPC